MSDNSPTSPSHAADPSARPAGGTGTGTLPTGPAGERPGGYPTAPLGSGLPAGGHGGGPGDPWSRRDGAPPGPPPTTPGYAPPPPGPPRRRRPVALVAGALAAVLLAGGIGGAVGYEAASSNAGGTSVLSSTSSSGGAPAPAAPAGSVEQVAATVLPSVVQLEGASGEGSGVIISADGLILTNAHVLEAGQPAQQQSPLGGLEQAPEGAAPSQAQGLTAVFQNGNRAPVQVVGTDPSADLAVVRAQGVSRLRPATLGDSSQLQVGQDVVAVGSPLGLSGTVTTGIVSALQRPVATGGAQSGQATVLDAIQTDAAINPGNSGGALVDMQGRVVGITSAIASLGGQSSGGQQSPSGSIGLGFAIPIDQAARIGNELVTQGFATRAVLGVGVTEGPEGAVLGQVAPGGPAATAGLVQGDVVTRVDDRVIPDADSLVAAIRSQQPGAQVTLTVTSAGGQPREVPVTLGSERAS
ncbi:trypsin-like peptidase domain-containing protein [Actinomycetospora lutea]|uniref:S1C family serine protease n=1 Tax=Actinomycetospora lutea TaxID=663604 RepID=UPI002365695F|nr:trypsin-like peptidase domain-containing protein [Actinomycetospora lutea]MDD7942539.1 trypsin-like peptidase domain-containing protein [Actinomycetospora lutea]